MKPRQLGVIELGTRPYREVLQLQRTMRELRLLGSIPHDLLILAEHPPVYTLGRRTSPNSLPLDASALQQLGADVVEIERGGDVTWHGPGQLIGYPIIHLEELQRTDLHWYLRTLETGLVAALHDLGLSAEAVPGKTGVWTGGKKIASIGVHVRRWVTLHGFALNVDPDLAWFAKIIPCGLPDVEMTSLRRELGGTTGLHRLVRDSVVTRLAEAISLVPCLVDLGQLLNSTSTTVKACDSDSIRPPFTHG